jgi:hypothetical protein
MKNTAPLHPPSYIYEHRSIRAAAIEAGTPLKGANCWAKKVN